MLSRFIDRVRQLCLTVDRVQVMHYDTIMYHTNGSPVILVPYLAISSSENKNKYAKGTGLL